ncbi:MAG: hypothetical protein WCO07_02050 [bacterium]
MSLEKPNFGLTPNEEKMYQKCIAMNPGITVEDWLELRGYAQKTTSQAVKKLYEVNGILMEEVPDKEDLEQLKGKN